MSIKLHANELISKFNQLKFKEGCPKVKKDPRMRRGVPLVGNIQKEEKRSDWLNSIGNGLVEITYKLNKHLAI